MVPTSTLHLLPPEPQLLRPRDGQSMHLHSAHQDTQQGEGDVRVDDPRSAQQSPAQQDPVGVVDRRHAEDDPSTEGDQCELADEGGPCGYDWDYRRD